MIGIYHSRDLDGYTSGAIMKLKYPDATLIGYDYGQPFPWDKIPPEEIVIMADVSLPMEDMLKLSMLQHREMVWIDHHISAINDFKEKCDGSRIIAVLDSSISACQGAWKFLFPEKQEPWCVKLLGDYDTWKNSDKKLWDEQILPFQFGMRLNCTSPETFPFGLFEDDSKDVVEIMKYGNVILKYQAGVNQANCKKAFGTIFRGYKAICLNGGQFNSDVFKSVYDPKIHDLMMPFQYDGVTGNWIVSIYSEKIDCSALAKEMGGGGHKGAAGFQTKDIYNIIGEVNIVFNESKNIEIK